MTGHLEQLAMRATVRIGPATAPGTLWGSGFLVAPGWVLTCAHILPLAEGAESVGALRVQGHGLDTGARLAYWLGGGTDPEQDLALVRLADDAAHGHVCVRLTDRYDPPHQVTAFGWRTPTGGAPQRWNGHSECNGRDGSYGLTLAPHMEIPHGASGGPLLDRDHGVVAGVVKARRAGKDGGLAVASTALRGFRDARPVVGEDSLGPDPYAALIREHDRWHQRRTGGPSWVRFQGELTGGGRGWAPRDSAEASALLAALPRPVSSAELQRMISQVLGYEPLWEDELAPVDWRDGQGWAHDQPDGAEIVALHYLLAVAQACRRRAPDAVAELERWVKARIEELPDFLAALLRERAVSDSRPTPDADRLVDDAAVSGEVTDPGDEGPVVAVELEPNPYGPGDRFHWRVWSWPDGADTPRVLDEDAGDEGSALAELPQVLDQPLRRAFRGLDAEERRARLELALPVEHFGLDAHRWPRSTEPPLGTQRQVVLRSLKRRGEPAAAWRERWDGVAANELKALPVHSPEYAKEALEEAAPGAVPVLCRPPQQSAASLADAIGAGYGVALWNLRGEHARACGTDCGELYGRAALLLGAADGAAALPERLRALRERADEEGGDGADTAWAAQLALLYDDPRRPIPVCDDLLESP
ncbi:trypsin-like peptidase domain-containing protein [Streptomyces sp. NRRL S-646]|uniref:VMAP-C domain-containing protein n=1 Tax=Streptomyces sp. NRRL S-646 TaxID=1463917 RepID=UPI0004C60DEA|nr:trypsin-like peptidase domain-containing protein [Streptomyces sp. NRRL S-646]